jgi:mannose-6-phosphate isomerase-like protein (cupin superfamily)
MSDYTIVNLDSVEDIAAKNGLEAAGEIRFPREAVEAQATGFGHMRLRPNARHPFPHRHHEAEEVYIVLSGSGRAKLEQETVELRPRDILRVAPAVARGFEAGPDGLELLAFGARHGGDGEIIEGFWGD